MKRSRQPLDKKRVPNPRKQPKVVGPDSHPIVQPQKEFAEEFRNLCYRGDLLLSELCRKLIDEAFGTANRMLIHLIGTSWFSNETWTALAVVYRLDRFVNYSDPGHLNIALEAETETGEPTTTSTELMVDLRERVTSGLQKRKNPKYGNIKLWADIWEAYWACILSEREIWGEDVEDIKCIFRQLLLLKHRALLPLSVNQWLETVPTVDTKQRESSSWGISVKDISEGVLIRNDVFLRDVFGGPPQDGSGNNVYGYWATYPRLTEGESGNYPPCEQGRTTCFGITAEEAAAKLVARINTGRTGITSDEMTS